MKLTLEIDVPDDQLPPNATGRLVWRGSNLNEYILSGDAQPVRVEEHNLYVGRVDLVIETREPWRVPEHLRHPAWNGCEIQRNQHDEGDYLMFRCGSSGSWYHIGSNSFLRIAADVVREMIPEHVYKLGEDAE